MTLSFLAIGALLARLGFTLYLSGLARAKNAAGAALRVAVDLGFTVLAFWAVGLAVMTGHLHAVFDLDRTFDARAVFWSVMLVWATAPMIGAVLERSRFLPALIVTAIIAAVVVPLAANWAWQGWLHNLGFIDIAGASVLHVTAGACAAAAALLVGPRSGKYNRDGSTNFIPGHNAPIVLGGTLAIFLGFLPTVMGLAQLHGADCGAAVADALLAAAAGISAATVYSHIRFGKPDLYLILTGFLGGMIASSGCAGAMPTWAAVVMGAIGGTLVPTAVVRLDLNHKIDDPGAAIAVHGIGGFWATLAPGLFVFNFMQLGRQILGALVIALLAFAVTATAFFLLKQIVRLRLTDAEEYDGADLLEHDLNAYPDFQQTMIKSYHLRET